MTDDTPKCGKCGLELTTGMMAAFCNHADQCEFWPHAERGDPDSIGGELFMAKAWMQNACEQIGLQIDARKRLTDLLARAQMYSSGGYWPQELFDAVEAAVADSETQTGGSDG